MWSKGLSVEQGCSHAQAAGRTRPTYMHAPTPCVSCGRRTAHPIRRRDGRRGWDHDAIMMDGCGACAQASDSTGLHRGASSRHMSTSCFTMSAASGRHAGAAAQHAHRSLTRRGGRSSGKGGRRPCTAVANATCGSGGYQAFRGTAGPGPGPGPGRLQTSNITLPACKWGAPKVPEGALLGSHQ